MSASDITIGLVIELDRAAMSRLVTGLGIVKGLIKDLESHTEKLISSLASLSSGISVGTGEVKAHTAELEKEKKAVREVATESEKLANLRRLVATSFAEIKTKGAAVPPLLRQTGVKLKELTPLWMGLEKKGIIPTSQRFNDLIDAISGLPPTAEITSDQITGLAKRFDLTEAEISKAITSFKTLEGVIVSAGLDFQRVAPIVAKANTELGMQATALKGVNQIYPLLIGFTRLTDETQIDLAKSLKLNRDQVIGLSLDYRFLTGDLARVNEGSIMTRETQAKLAAGTKFLSGIVSRSGATYNEAQDALTTLSAQYGAMRDETRKAAMMQHLMQNAIFLNEEGLTALSTVTGKSKEELVAYSQGVQWTTTQLNRMREVARVTTAQLGIGGAALRTLGRELFWTGLGTMFLTMSFARMLRMQASLGRSARGIIRIERDLRDAREEAREALMVYGRASEEYTRASERMKDVEFSLAEAHIRVKEQTQMLAMSWMMLFLGAFPTALRTGTAVMTFLHTLQKAQMGHVVTTNVETSSIMQGAYANMFNAATKKTLIATGAGAAATDVAETGTKTGLLSVIWGLVSAQMVLNAVKTLGVGIAIMLASAVTAYTFSLKLAEMQMGGMKGKMEELRKEYGLSETALTGHSLVSALRETVNVMREFPSTIKTTQEFIPAKIPTLPEEELLREFQVIPAISPELVEAEKKTFNELKTLREGLGIHSPLEVEVTQLPIALEKERVAQVNIYGPWYIREETDITKTAREIRRVIMKQTTARGRGL